TTTFEDGGEVEGTKKTAVRVDDTVQVQVEHETLLRLAAAVAEVAELAIDGGRQRVVVEVAVGHALVDLHEVELPPRADDDVRSQVTYASFLHAKITWSARFMQGPTAEPVAPSRANLIVMMAIVLGGERAQSRTHQSPRAKHSFGVHRTLCVAQRRRWLRVAYECTTIYREVTQRIV
ncbi:hypothetical protein EJB05_50859, partial [Eragrostis curvula]